MLLCTVLTWITLLFLVSFAAGQINIHYFIYDQFISSGPDDSGVSNFTVTYQEFDIPATGSVSSKQFYSATPCGPSHMFSSTAVRSAYTSVLSQDINGNFVISFALESLCSSSCNMIIGAQQTCEASCSKESGFDWYIIKHSIYLCGADEELSKFFPTPLTYPPLN